MPRKSKQHPLASPADHVFDLRQFESLQVFISDEQGRHVCYVCFRRAHPEEFRNEIDQSELSEEAKKVLKESTLERDVFSISTFRHPLGSLSNALHPACEAAPDERLQSQSVNFHYSPDWPAVVIHGQPGKGAVRICTSGGECLERVDVSVYGPDNSLLHTMTTYSERGPHEQSIE
ncbi:MAG TPA: hypothetical protein VNI02_17450 [Blastocatellia bacterium]|jgi:hypothetical protein|nr:hypothetical protein [Blastocatellia bacterium]